MNWPNSDAAHLMVTADQMAVVENKIFSKGLSTSALMEKVGQVMTSWFDDHQDLLANGVIVLVGPGHNGGDGLVVARELFQRGIHVEIWCPFSLTKKLTIGQYSYAKWLGIHELLNPPPPDGKSLWVEALFGLGQSRPLPNSIAELLKAREKAQPKRLVSLDVPAGLCSDSGQPIEGIAAVANYTLTVGLLKQGLIQDEALPYVGHLERIDIGFSNVVLDVLENKLPLRVTSPDISLLKLPLPQRGAMKYQRGRLLIIAGSEAYPGAAFLSIKGALASGVGSIKAILPKLVSRNLWNLAPEIVLAGVLDSSKAFLTEIESNRIDSLLVGPGLGGDKEMWGALEKKLHGFIGLLVLDADALNLLASYPEVSKWLLTRKGPTWITPNKAEFSRLFPHLQKLVPIKAALEAATSTGTFVLLKGAHSVIADPDGSIWQIGESCPLAARAGLGDVLAGFAAGLGAIKTDHKYFQGGELLAAAGLLHAHAGLLNRKSSSASSIAECLAELTREIQSAQC